MRATAAALTLILVLAGTGPSLAFCQTLCAPAEAPAHHSGGAVDHHGNAAGNAAGHAAHSSVPVSTMESGAGCETLAQISLLRRRETMSATEHEFGVAPPDSQDGVRSAPARRDLGALLSDHHDPPAPAFLAAPLRI